MTINIGKTQSFILDTSSTINIRPKGTFERLNLGLQPFRTDVKITGVTGHKLKVMGEVKLEVRHASGKGQTSFIIAGGNSHCILGLRGLRDLTL